jgi:CubicO group peptidase (beta-lactamase class C family)
VRRAFAGVFIAAVTVTLGAQSAPPGFARDRLAYLDRFLDEAVKGDRAAGAVVLILRDGKPVYERAVGWADKENGRRMQMDTIFRIASQTKAVTSVAALMLIEEGKLHPSDAVGRYIDSFNKTTVAVTKDDQLEIVPARRRITVRDLLTHTAGISYGTARSIADRYAAASLGPEAGFGWYTADKSESICVTMERLGTLPFSAQPGESWVYGYNTDVLGCVVERVSGMSLDEFIRTRITNPLGMRDTFFYLPSDRRDRLAAVYSYGMNGSATRAPEGSRGQGHYVEGPRKSFAGGAGLLSTIRDYARFLEMIRNDGELDGTRLLNPRSVRLMHTNHVGTLHSSTGLGFGFGFETTDRFGASGLACAGSYGWGGAYGTQYLIDPESRMTLLMMQQVLPPAVPMTPAQAAAQATPVSSDLRQRFLTVAYQALVERPTARCVDGG